MRGALLGARKGGSRPFIAALLFFSAVWTAAAAGLTETEQADERELLPPEESLRRADDSIRTRLYDDAVPSLLDAVYMDPEQLPAAQQRFNQIREARAGYVAKGREVEAELRELISGEIPPQLVIPTAFRALSLIAEMSAILPFPNPEDRILVAELQSRVLLTIDRRRFEALMAAAEAAIRTGDYVRAVEIYVNGLGDYGFAFAADTDATTAEDGAQIDALLETDGIAMQIGGFSPNDFGLSGPRFAVARDAIRMATVDDPEGAFTAIAGPAADQAQLVTEAFASGDFAAAQNRVPDYLTLLQRLTGIYRILLETSEVIAELEAINAERVSFDEEYRYSWHVRFVSDIILGRRGPTGDERRREGVLHTVEAVWDAVTEGPNRAAQESGATRYTRAMDSLDGFAWLGLAAPADNDPVNTHLAEASALLGHAAFSYRTAAELLNLAGVLGLAVPASEQIVSAADLVPLSAELGTVEDEALRSTLLEALVRIGSARELDRVVRIAASAYQVGSVPVSNTSTAALEAQRQSIRLRLQELTDAARRWQSFMESVGDTHPDPPGIVTATTPLHALYVEETIDRVREYELTVVRQAARIRISGLENRLQAYQSVIGAAMADLAARDPLSQAPRPRTADARNRLLPIVGAVSGVQVASTTGGSLHALRVDAQSLAGDLRDNEGYVVDDEDVRAVIDRADTIARIVGTEGDGLLAQAAELLAQSLRQIVEAEQLERRGDERVREIEQRIAEARFANDAGDLVQANRLVELAGNLLSSNDPQDASNLFTKSLENWYRPDLEARWLRTNERLSRELNESRRVIVVARVDTLAAEAEPLVFPPVGEEPRPGEAILLLEEADALWSSVSPFVQNPRIAPLLRRARILQSQQQQALSEELPGFERLSQTLNNARVAFDRGDYATARRAISFFLTEQPLNTEARLLDIRLELATGEGSADAIVRAYVNRSLAEATQQDNDGEAVERAILSGTVSDEVFGNLLPLQSKLQAIRDIVTDQGVPLATSNRIDSILASVEGILNPPPPPPPPNPAQVANDIINRQLARGNWSALSIAELIAVYEELERAQSIFRTDRARQLIVEVQRLLPPPDTPTPAEQGIMNRATVLFQGGDAAGALSVLEQYMAVAERDPMLIPAWSRLYDDLMRRLRRQ